MKKILIGLAALILILAGAGTYWYHLKYGGESYYMQVMKDGKKSLTKDDAGKDYTYYDYKEKVYQKAGKEKEVEFTADHNLRKTAYLKLTVNIKKGVTSWEEVKKSEVPEKALTKITNQAGN
ncbi:YxeA family protein [Lactococcus kimchii]|uniref:YxeA family protein n=1 Tax=Lactococcus sp. S-13 TaxID=2507158 RepID=UPI0010230F14|nr:YxeA family protein [Lactococcus sp. S-13]RZI48956.1 YxeA family protein [Lactococcus sp. S-13]